MVKRVLTRFFNGMCCSVTITLIIQILVMPGMSHVPLLPEFASRFESEVMAYAAQLMLIGLMSGVTSAGTAVFEMKKIGLLSQSLIYLVIMLSAWIPVSCIAWGFHRYRLSMIVTFVCIVVSYGITWWLQYVLCRREIDAINAKLQEKEGD